jgi:hypothetical protein
MKEYIENLINYTKKCWVNYVKYVTGLANDYLFFAWWRAPQLMLRTNHSLKAFCAILVIKMSSFFTKFYK